MNPKLAHDYLFYKLYRLMDKVATPKSLNDLRAVICIVGLEMFTALSLLNYYEILFNNNSSVLHEKWLLAFICIVVVFFNYMYFWFKDGWKRIIPKFDKWPIQRNKVGSVVVGLFIAIVIGNFIVSCCLFKR